MLSIKNLSVATKEKEILKNFSIDINDGEIHAVMGPNGTGKSTLSKVILGSNDYIVTSGDITFNNERLNDLTTDERAKRGIFLSFQEPISIEGVTNSEFLRTAINERRDTPIGLYEFIKELDSATSELEMPDGLLHRAINKGASGGERKKNEILQMKLLKPKFIILDELDSGLDIDSLKIVCENINKYLQENPKTSVLIITHYPRILEYIKPKYVHILLNGQIVKTGGYELATEIEKNGYSKINTMDGKLENE